MGVKLKVDKSVYIIPITLIITLWVDLEDMWKYDPPPFSHDIYIKGL